MTVTVDCSKLQFPHNTCCHGNEMLNNKLQNHLKKYKMTKTIFPYNTFIDLAWFIQYH